MDENNLFKKTEEKNTENQNPIEKEIKNNKKRNIGLIFVFIGLTALVAAGMLFIFNITEDIKAGKKAEAVYEEVKKANPDEDRYVPEIDASYLGTGEMPFVEIDGIKYIGTVEVPSRELKLPVQSEWDEELSKLSPCRYKGSAYDRNLIIAGHNYKTHFRPIKTLELKDEVIFTDIDGHVFNYEVKDIEVMEMHEVERMEQGEWDITLFTCTYGGGYRIALRCALR